MGVKLDSAQGRELYEFLLPNMTFILRELQFNKFGKIWFIGYKFMEFTFIHLFIFLYRCRESSGKLLDLQTKM